MDLESEVMGSIPTGGNIYHWLFCFRVVKPLLPILALLPFLWISKKTLLSCKDLDGGISWMCHSMNGHKHINWFHSIQRPQRRVQTKIIANFGA